MVYLCNSIFFFRLISQFGKIPASAVPSHQCTCTGCSAVYSHVDFILQQCTNFLWHQGESASGYLHWQSDFGMDIDGLFAGMGLVDHFRALKGGCGAKSLEEQCTEQSYRINPCPNAALPSLPMEFHLYLRLISQFVKIPVSSVLGHQCTWCLFQLGVTCKFNNVNF